MAKQYNSFTGIKGFHYKVKGGTVQSPEAIEGLQEVTISKEQEIVKGSGDNRTMETAVSNSDIEIETGFHALPMSDKVALFGLEEDSNGLVYVGNDTPSEVACLFERTDEVGGREVVGLFSGKFLYPETEGATKSDGETEFSSQSTSATFIPVQLEGMTEPKAMVMGYDAKGETTALYGVWEKVFGEKHPNDTTPVEENTGA